MQEYIPQQGPAFTTEPIHPNEIYANELQEERVKNVIAQTSPDILLAELEWRIKGYKKNLSTQTWDKISSDLKEPSQLLVSRYISYLSSLLNDNTRFTNLTDVEINKMMKLMIEYLTDDLDANSEEYGLGEDYTEMTRIAHIILNSTFVVLKRSQNGMESRRIWNALNMSETMNSMQQPQKKHFWEFWK